MRLALRSVLPGLLLLLALAPVGAGAAATRDAPPQFFSLGIGDLATELEDVRAKGKQALLLVFEQEGCPACLYMHKNVLNRSDVLALYGKHFVSLSLDVNGAVPLRDLAGREMTEKSYSQTAKVRGTPTFIFYDLKGAEIVRAVGAVKPDEFLVLGQFVASGAYRTRSLAQFKQESASGQGKKVF